MTLRTFGFETEVSLYCAGFPCQPYSVLSNTRQMLSDPNAKQLLRVIKRIKRYRPKAAWHVSERSNTLRLLICMLAWFQVVLLENVLGFMPLVAGLIELIHENCKGFLGCKIHC